MNKYKRKAVILRSNMARHFLFSLLGDPEIPENSLEKMFHMYRKCTAFTIIKYLYNNGYISRGRCASMVGCSLQELYLHYGKFLNKDSEDESYFGV